MPSEKMGGEIESSDSLSSQSEKYAEDQINCQSPEVTSNETDNENNGFHDSLPQGNESKVYTDTYSQISDSAKDDQSTNVAKIYVDKDSEPEKVAKTSNDCKEDNSSVEFLSEKLSATLLNVSVKDDMVKQLAKVAEEAVAGWEKAEKEVTTVRQQLETAIQAVSEKTNELELSRKEFEAQSDELEIRTIERDLSIKAAETASKQYLDTIKKVAKLEAECRKLKSVSRVSSIAGFSSYTESLTDCHSDGGKQPTSLEAESRKINGSGNPGCSESRASALIAELDQLKTENVGDLMEDFLEMERLAALPMHDVGNRGVQKPVHGIEDKVRVELNHRTAELEAKIEKIEAEKDELTKALVQTQKCFETSQALLIETQMKMEQLENERGFIRNGEFRRKEVAALVETQERLHKSEVQLGEAEAKLGKLERELNAANEEKISLRSHLDSLQIEVQAIKQEDIESAAVKLADCQKTIASIGIQLKSLDTLEDFLIDTGSIPGQSTEPWKLHSNHTVFT